jgi:hypothetical protein
MTASLTASVARAIEEQWFREHFARRWIVAAYWPDHRFALPDNRGVYEDVGEPSLRIDVV